ncbi:hypothetical protein QA600_10340 [Natronococcus sp. A-GB1]|uniref:hypothetical protein n=1 Tax=Natronococcus sp. A-GB1 TaxID=3037648 RepID=UPI00241C0E8A|nr:hypothetical protein [Natronococcus sp. A-GB1]MDG5759739.1 hypothetical protein [Natronococcus sp. A-GB1]
MSSREPFGQGVRLAAIVLVVAALAGLIVWAGASPAEPMESELPDETEVPNDRADYVGEEVVLGGEVVETDPVVIATRASGYGQFTVLEANAAVQNTDDPLEVGDQVTASGTLEDEETLAAERATVQEPGDTRYMMLISLLGGFLVVGRVLRDWRFDLERLAFVPRERARSRGYSSDSAAEDGRERTDDALEAPAGGDRGG